MKWLYPSSFSILMLLLWTSPGIGSSDWVEHYKDKNGDVILYKIEHRINHTVQVWGKRVFSDEGGKEFVRDSRNNGLPTEGWRKPGHYTSLYEMECVERLGRVLSAVIYDVEGKVIYASSFGHPKWEFIVPDSIGDSFRKEACK
ncbi:MAG: hypothetical protein K4571_08450 [Deltaproteobacteria bacterium]